MPVIRLAQLPLVAAAVLLTALPALAQHTPHPANQPPPQQQATSSGGGAGGEAESDCACKNKAGANLLPNGEFETTVQGSTTPVHWAASVTHSARVVDLSADFRRAVQIQGSPAQMANNGIELVSDPIKVQSNSHYRCRGYIRSEAPRQDVIIRGYINVPRLIEGRTVMVEQAVSELRKPWKPLNQWRHFTFEFDMNPVNHAGRPQPIDHIRVILVSHQYGGTCWFDDVRVETVAKEKPSQP